MKKYFVSKWPRKNEFSFRKTSSDQNLKNHFPIGNRTIWKNWPCTKGSMTFPYVGLYLDNVTAYGYHVIDLYFLQWHSLQIHLEFIHLEIHLELPCAWGRDTQCSQKWVSVYFSYGIPELQNWYTIMGSFLHKWDKNNRWSHEVSCLLPDYYPLKSF